MTSTTWRGGLTFAFMLAFAMFGCRKGPADSGILIDDLGRSVALPDSVVRVVSLAPNVTELVFAAGGGDRLVAVSTADDYPPEVGALPKLDALPLNFESLIAIDPDVVLLNAEINRIDDAERLTSLGIAAFVTQTNRLTEVPGDVRALGRVLGTERAANAQADLLQAAIDSLASLTRNVSRPGVLFLIGYNTLYAFGAGSYIHELIDIAGGKSLTDSLKQNPVLNEEFVLAANPEFIIVAGDETFRVSDLLEAHPAFSGLSAVKNARVRVIDADQVLRAGPRLVSGAYRIASILHPDLF